MAASTGIRWVKKDGTLSEDFFPMEKQESVTIGRCAVLSSHSANLKTLNASIRSLTSLSPFPFSSTRRDQDCSIRVKLATVSRNHGLITVDENGEYRLANLSKTNPITINNSKMDTTTIVLRNGDVFCVGERSFVFEHGEFPARCIGKISVQLGLLLTYCCLNPLQINHSRNGGVVPARQDQRGRRRASHHQGVRRVLL